MGSSAGQFKTYRIPVSTTRLDKNAKDKAGSEKIVISFISTKRKVLLKANQRVHESSKICFRIKTSTCLQSCKMATSKYVYSLDVSTFIKSFVVNLSVKLSRGLHLLSKHIISFVHYGFFSVHWVKICLESPGAVLDNAESAYRSAHPVFTLTIILWNKWSLDRSYNKLRRN